MEKDFRKKSLEQALQDEDSTQAKILKAAEDLFARRGYTGTRTRDIAEAAGVNIAMLHYHWGTKEELWNAIHYSLMEKAYQYGIGLFKEVAGKDQEEALRVIIYGFFDFIADNPNIPLIMQQPKFKAKRPWAEDVGVPFFKALFDFIRDETDLDFSPADTGLAMFFFLGAFEFMFIRPDLVRYYLDQDPDNLSDEFREYASEALCTLLLRFGRRG